jgi:hypothetical protein
VLEDGGAQVLQIIAICPDCGEPHPAGKACPACRGEPSARFTAPAPEYVPSRRARLGLLALSALGAMGIGLAALIALR